MSELGREYVGGDVNQYKTHGAYHWHYYGRIPVYTRHVDHVLGMFEGKTGSLLDVGCGDGLISHLLDQQGFDVVGVDSNRLAIFLAKQKAPSLRFVCKDVRKLATKFEYVLASEVIEHIKDDLGFLRNLNGLFFGGALITTVIPHKKLYPGHVREYTQPQFTRIVHQVFPNAAVHVYGGHLYAWVEK